MEQITFILALFTIHRMCTFKATFVVLLFSGLSLVINGYFQLSYGADSATIITEEMFQYKQAESPLRPPVNQTGVILVNGTSEFSNVTGSGNDSALEGANIAIGSQPQDQTNGQSSENSDNAVKCQKGQELDNEGKCSDNGNTQSEEQPQNQSNSQSNNEDASICQKGQELDNEGKCSDNGNTQSEEQQSNLK